MKRKNLCFARGSACLLGGAALAISAQATAATAPPPCPTTNAVYMSGSSSYIPVIQAVANVLGSAVNIVYQKPGSCEGFLYVLGDTGTAVLPDADASLSLAPNGPSGGAACTLPTIAVGATTEAAAKVDIAVSDVYVATCQGSFDTALNSVGASTMTKEYLGPIQAQTFAVASASTEQVISAEAAYMVFGFGAATAANTINPWNTPGDIYVRFWDSGTLESIATAINLPGGKWVNATNKLSAQTAGNAQTMASDLLAAATTTASTNATIGILASSNYVAGLRPLAFQAVGQSCGYLPDSSSTAHDKLNVRQGRYAIWGPEHLVVNVDSNGNTVGQNSNTASVQLVLNTLVATSQAPAASSADGGVTDAEEGTIISAISVPAVGVIPQCAMQVIRTSEIGPEASYAPPAACSCAFEEAAGSVVPGHTCTACTGAGTGVCTGATPACHFGYCEAE